MSDWTTAAEARTAFRESLPELEANATPFVEHGSHVARMLIGSGLIPTADHRGWTDALTWCANMLGTVSHGNPIAAVFLNQVAYQVLGAALLLDDLAPDRAS